MLRGTLKKTVYLKTLSKKEGGRLEREGVTKHIIKNTAKRNMSSTVVCFVNVQSSLHENVVISVCAHMDNAA